MNKDPHVISLEDIPGTYWGQVDKDGREIYESPRVANAAQAAVRPSLSPVQTHTTVFAPQNILDLARARLADVHKRLAEFHGLEAEAAMLERMIAAADVKDYQ